MNRTPSALESDSASTGPPAARGRWLVVAIAVGLVAAPLLWTGVPKEIARWHCAAAAESELDEDFSRALQQVERAMAWSDTDPELYAYRASLKLKLKDLDGALDDCDRAVSLTPDGSLYVYFQRVLVQQRRGDHAAALQDVEKLVQMASDGAAPQLLPTGQVFGMDYENALNLRAYSRALGNIEIEQGLADIDAAFQRAGTEEIPAYLDTRGFLRYLAGNLPDAERDMQRAVTLAEAMLARFQREERVGDLRVWNRQERQLREDLAVLLQHRGLVLEALQRPEQAATDFERAKQYGYSPEDGVW